jgi:hypothetical protein
VKFSLLFRFVFASFQLHFASDAKTSEKTLFSHRSEKIFFCFASFRFEVKKMAVFRFRFASFRFEAKIMAVFRFFFVLFSLRSIFVYLQNSMFRIDAKQAKKHFFRIKAKKISFLFRFISLWSENDGAPYFHLSRHPHPSLSLSWAAKNHGRRISLSEAGLSCPCSLALSKKPGGVSATTHTFFLIVGW